MTSLAPADRAPPKPRARPRKPPTKKPAPQKPAGPATTRRRRGKSPSSDELTDDDEQSSEESASLHEEDTESEYPETESEKEAPRKKRRKAAAKEASDSEADGNDYDCSVCGKDGTEKELLCCEACPRVYHLDCLTPPLTAVPEGNWYCPHCAPGKELCDVERIMARRPRAQAADGDKPVRTGSNATSPRRMRAVRDIPARSEAAPDAASAAPEAKSAVEVIEEAAALGKRGQADDRGAGWEYLLKFRGRGYIHCRWAPEEALRAAGKMVPAVGRKLQNFLRASATQEADEADDPDAAYGIRSAWKVVDRVIAERVADADSSRQDERKRKQAEQRDEHGSEPNGQEREGNGTASDARQREFLVKWRELQYEACTWESEADMAEWGAHAEIARFRALEPIQDSAQARKEAAVTDAGAPPERRFTATPDHLAGGQLHEYQLEGLNWLVFSWQQRQHVILADEMGLGKTIQTIAYLSTLHADGVSLPHLIVVPLSTVTNWEREFALWAAHLNVVTLVGNAAARDTIREHELYAKQDGHGKQSRDRASLQARVKVHAIVTSYEVAMMEATELRKLEFEALVVDEGHRLKNSSSRLFQILKSFSTVHRVLLTGTPLQNNLAELFMLMHFLDATKFGSLEEFQTEYEDLGEAKQVERLHELLKPHLLRRLKKDVLRTLPPKREQMVRVELSQLQKDYYRAILTKSYPVLASQGRDKPTTLMSNIIMELRKCCNHPYLFPGAEAAFVAPGGAGAKRPLLEAMIEASGKLALVDQMIRRLRQRGHRILIYTQFITVLDILEDWLVGRGWGYQRIDGGVASQERQKRIDAFNNRTEDYSVFLLSTRAGGLGINLATADTVIIFDSDWNPHMDLQAQARAHRLGQTRAVMIYRLVTRATVEERMMQASKKKLVLEHLVVRAAAGRSLAPADLEDIIRYGAAALFSDDDRPRADKPATAAAGAGDEAVKAENQLANGSAEAKPASELGIKSEPAGKEEEQNRAKPADPDGAAADDDDKAGGGDAEPAAKAVKRRDPLAEREAKDTVAAEEAAAGRTGGGTERAIVYNDDALDKLLDRSDLEKGLQQGDEDEVPESDFMKAFKVANFNIVEQPIQEVMAEASKEAAPPSGSFWDGLLRNQYQQLKALELAAMGKGKRDRKKVSYHNAGGGEMDGSEYEASSSDEETEEEGEEMEPEDDDAKKKTKRKRTPAKPAGLPQPLPPTTGPAMTGPADNRLVLGFNAAQRHLFMRLLLRWGLGDMHTAGPAKGHWKWDHLTAAMKMSEDTLARYGRVVLAHLNERPDEGGQVFQDGIPRQLTLVGQKPREAMERLSLMQFARVRLRETAAQPAEEALGRLPLAKTRAWRPDHDRALLMGVVRHGFGQWRDILLDGELGLQSVLREELGYTPAAMIAQLSADKIEKDIAAGPQGEDNGDRVKTARAEADAARERAETIQRSRNCEWLRLRWHAVATSIRTDFFEKQKQLTQPPPPSVLAQRAQQQAMLLQKASSSTGGVVLAGAPGLTIQHARPTMAVSSAPAGAAGNMNIVFSGGPPRPLGATGRPVSIVPRPPPKLFQGTAAGSPAQRPPGSSAPQQMGLRPPVGLTALAPRPSTVRPVGPALPRPSGAPQQRPVQNSASATQRPSPPRPAVSSGSAASASRPRLSPPSGAFPRPVFGVRPAQGPAAPPRPVLPPRPSGGDAAAPATSDFEPMPDQYLSKRSACNPPTEPAMIGSPMPEECTARLQLVAGFNRLAATVVRIQEEARAAHDGPKKQRVLAEAGERFRAGLKAMEGVADAMLQRLPVGFKAVPADSYMQPGRQQAHAELAAIQRSAMAAKVGKARAKAADTRAARLAQQNGGIAVQLRVQQGAQQAQGGAAKRPALPPQPPAGKKRGRPPKQPMPGLAPPALVGTAGAGMLGKEAENRRVRVWWPDDKAWYAGVIAAYNARKGVHWVEYDDGDEEWVDLRKERWEFLDPPVAASGSGAQPRGRPVKQDSSDGDGVLSLALLAAAAESADIPSPAKPGPVGHTPRPLAQPAAPAVRPAPAAAASRGTPLAPTVQAGSSNPLAPRPAGPHWLRPPGVAPPRPHAAVQPELQAAMSADVGQPLAPAEAATIPAASAKIPGAADVAPQDDKH